MSKLEITIAVEEEHDGEVHTTGYTAHSIDEACQMLGSYERMRERENENIIDAPVED